MSWLGNQPPSRQRAVGLHDHPSGSYTGGQAEVSPGSLVISQGWQSGGILLKQTQNFISVCRFECIIQGPVGSELWNQGIWKPVGPAAGLILTLVLIEKESGGSPWQLERGLTMCLLVVNCSTELKSVPQKVVLVYLEPVNITLFGNSLHGCNQVKMRSAWISLGPKSNVTDFL